MPPDPSKPIFLCMGPSQHGKTTVRKMLVEKTGFAGDSTSNVIYAMISFLTGKSEEELRAIPKEEFRARLIEYGDWITQHADKLSPELDAMLTKEGREALPALEQSAREPSALVRMLFLAGACIIDGVRRKRELLHALTHLAWAGYHPVTLWIENPNKPVNPKDNLELTKDFVKPSFVIVNDGDLDALEQKVEGVLKTLGWNPAIANPAKVELPPEILDSKGNVIVEDFPTVTTK